MWGVFRIGFGYGESSFSAYVSHKTSHTERHVCYLDGDEKITKVVTWPYLIEASKGIYTRSGIAFETNKKWCGPYGNIDAREVDIIEGNNLLAIHGTAGDSFDEFNFMFESC